MFHVFAVFKKEEGKNMLFPKSEGWMHILDVDFSERFWIILGYVFERYRCGILRLRTLFYAKWVG